MMRIRNLRKETIIEKYYIKDFAALFSHVIYLENKMHAVRWEPQKICKTASWDNASWKQAAVAQKYTFLCEPLTFFYSV